MKTLNTFFGSEVEGQIELTEEQMEILGGGQVAEEDEAPGDGQGDEGAG